jgi:hypothetical protein
MLEAGVTGLFVTSPVARLFLEPISENQSLMAWCRSSFSKTIPSSLIAGMVETTELLLTAGASVTLCDAAGGRNIWPFMTHPRRPPYVPKQPTVSI